MDVAYETIMRAFQGGIQEKKLEIYHLKRIDGQ